MNCTFVIDPAVKLSTFALTQTKLPVKLCVTAVLVAVAPSPIVIPGISTQSLSPGSVANDP